MTKTKTVPLLAKQLMNTNACCCTPDTTLNEAARLLWEGDVGAVPVVAGGDRRVVGMLTDRDICMAAYTRNLPLSDIRAESVMSSDVISCRPEDRVEAVQEKMRVHQVRRLPVTDREGRLKGIVSLNDLAREASRGNSALSRSDVADTLARVGRPRRKAKATAS